MSIPALQTLFLAAAAGLFLFWLAVALIPIRKTTSTPVIAVLRYGRPWRLAGLAVALAIPTLLAVLVLRTPWSSPQRLLLAGGILTGLSVLGGALLLEAERVVLTLTDDGIIGDSPWRRRRVIRWTEIERVAYSPLNRWHAIRGAGGQVIRASAYLDGLPLLLQMLRERVSITR